MADSLVMNYLKVRGKSIGAAARNGDKLCQEIVTTYALYEKCPGPAELGILHELIHEHENLENSLEGKEQTE